jgi:cell division protein FtsQ
MPARKPVNPAKLRRSQPLPADVRVTNAAANTLFALLALVLAAAALVWLARWPGFVLRDVQLLGALQRTNLPTLRAHVAPHLKGSFFSLDLHQVQAAFESVPWVRRAVVRRVWPDGLVVRLEEHRPAALWQGGGTATGSERLVNDLGEVFEASAADIDDMTAAAPAPSGTGSPTPAAAAALLPTLAGPDGSAAAMLSLVRRLAPVLAQIDQHIETLELSDRGSWRAETRAAAVIELGRGEEDQIVARATQFVQTVAEATDKWRAPLEVADLRHSDGYAVRLRGISVSAAASAPGNTKTN